MESQPLAAVVLAAGLGKRMMSQQPKVLHRLAGLPLAAHVLRALAPLAPTRTIAVVGHGADQVEAALGSSYGPDGSLSLSYALQPEQLGTANAMLVTEPALRDFDGPILVLYGDSPLLRTATLSALISRHRQFQPKITMLTCIAADPTGYGRVVRDQNQNLVEVVEERNATLVQRAISEVNVGVYIFDSGWLWPHLQKVQVNSQGEYYLTDVIGMAIREEKLRSQPGRRGMSESVSSSRSVVTFTLDGLEEAMGINSREQLAQAERAVQNRLRQMWLREGVTMLVPESVYLGMDAEIGNDTVLYPGVILEGNTRIGSNCLIGPNTRISNSTVGDDCRIVSSTVEDSTVDDGVAMGPYSHIRGGTHLSEGVHLGNFAEVKNSTFGREVRMHHFSYVGDATVGDDANISAGVITANYDGVKKHRTKIGKGAFIGVDTSLRAPVTIGDGAQTGAGSVVLNDVPANTTVAGVPARALPSKKGVQADETVAGTLLAEETSQEQVEETGKSEQDT